MERSRSIWEELGLPPLKPRMPWYGYSLGAWTKEDEEEAELAVRRLFCDRRETNSAEKETVATLRSKTKREAMDS
jgi:4-hydroxy-3-polyprenylbenzoate decarboxylase